MSDKRPTVLSPPKGGQGCAEYASSIHLWVYADMSVYIIIVVYSEIAFACFSDAHSIAPV